MMQVFQYFDKAVTKENSYQVQEAYSVSQDLLAVLDGESTSKVFQVCPCEEGGVPTRQPANQRQATLLSRQC